MNLFRIFAWIGGMLVRARWLRGVFRATAIPGVLGAGALVGGLCWDIAWLRYIGYVLVAPFVLVFGVIPVLVAMTVVGLLMQALVRGLFRPSRKQQLERAMQAIAAAKVKREARKAARGPSFLTGTGEPEPRIGLYATVDDDLDIQLKEGEELTSGVVFAARARRERRLLEELALGASRLGGVPDLPPETAWPVHDGKRMAFLAQIDLAEMPRAGHTLLPADGWLYVFGLFDGEDAHWPPPVKALLHRGVRSALVRAAWQGEGVMWSAWSGESVHEVVPVVGRLQGSGPEDAATGGSKREDDRREAGWLYGEVDEVDGSAGEIADDSDCSGDDWINLLAIRSVGSMHWSDSGVLYLLARRSDLATEDFGNLCVAIRSG